MRGSGLLVFVCSLCLFGRRSRGLSRSLCAYRCSVARRFALRFGGCACFAQWLRRGASVSCLWRCAGVVDLCRSGSGCLFGRRGSLLSLGLLCRRWRRRCNAGRSAGKRDGRRCLPWACRCCRSSSSGCFRRRLLASDGRANQRRHCRLLLPIWQRDVEFTMTTHGGDLKFTFDVSPNKSDSRSQSHNFRLAQPPQSETSRSPRLTAKKQISNHQAPPPHPLSLSIHRSATSSAAPSHLLQIDVDLRSLGAVGA